MTGVRTTTFLLVDDDENDVFFVDMEFKKGPANIRLKRVSDGFEAKQYLNGEGKYANRSDFPLPDVILLDLHMPRFDGFDFLTWIHSEIASGLSLIPVVVMSSSLIQRDIHRAYQLGANSYVVKPSNLVQLKIRLQALRAFWVDHAEKPPIIVQK
jgi:CheY-like chemotaxis protein